MITRVTRSIAFFLMNFHIKTSIFMRKCSRAILNKLSFSQLANIGGKKSPSNSLNIQTTPFLSIFLQEQKHSFGLHHRVLQWSSSRRQHFSSSSSSFAVSSPLEQKKNEQYFSQKIPHRSQSPHTKKDKVDAQINLLFFRVFPRNGGLL